MAATSPSVCGSKSSLESFEYKSETQNSVCSDLRVLEYKSLMLSPHLANFWLVFTDAAASNKVIIKSAGMCKRALITM